MEEKIKKLKEYFEKRDDIVMAFLFGSQASERAHTGSDWDIAAYFTPEVAWPEWEEHGREYPAEDTVWSDCMKIVQSDNVDFIVLNRIPSSIAAAALRGMPLVIKDRGLYIDFMLIVTREAEDFCEFVHDYFAISERSRSLTESDQARLAKIIQFLEEQAERYPEFVGMTMSLYQTDKRARNDVERWIENTANALIDISKILLASNKRLIPDAYRDTVNSAALLLNFPEKEAEKFASWVRLRNVLAHEYLDIKWQRISSFIRESKPYITQYIDATKRFLANQTAD